VAGHTVSEIAELCGASPFINLSDRAALCELRAPSHHQGSSWEVRQRC
jgi:hypothetical protein